VTVRLCGGKGGVTVKLWHLLRRGSEVRWGAQQDPVFDVLGMCKQSTTSLPLATGNPLQSQRVQLSCMPDARRRRRRRKPD